MFIFRSYSILAFSFTYAAFISFRTSARYRLLLADSLRSADFFCSSPSKCLMVLVSLVMSLRQLFSSSLEAFRSRSAFSLYYLSRLASLSLYVTSSLRDRAICSAFSFYLAILSRTWASYPAYLSALEALVYRESTVLELSLSLYLRSSAYSAILLFSAAKASILLLFYSSLARDLLLYFSISIPNLLIS